MLLEGAPSTLAMLLYLYSAAQMCTHTETPPEALQSSYRSPRCKTRCQRPFATSADMQPTGRQVDGTALAPPHPRAWLTSSSQGPVCVDQVLTGIAGRNSIDLFSQLLITAVHFTCRGVDGYCDGRYSAIFPPPRVSTTALP